MSDFQETYEQEQKAGCVVTLTLAGTLLTVICLVAAYFAFISTGGTITW